MEAVKNDLSWDLVFPDSSDPMYAEKWDGNMGRWKEMGGKVIKHKTVRAQDIWTNIIESAWSSAEPGMYFIDRANYYSNSWYYADLPCTNPCGEQPLPAWGVCNLGHVNLARHVDAEKKTGPVLATKNQKDRTRSEISAINRSACFLLFYRNLEVFASF
jgi:ribonucleoside-diphosphate reductase alpha chain